MNISFDKAKNGDITAIYNNITLHSSYNPQREAQRFVSNINIPYTPPVIFILEPCVSYIVPLIKEKYRESKIAIIRYTFFFNEYNNGCDYVLNYYEHENDFSQYLYNSFGEEVLMTSFFIEWEPTSKAFPDTQKNVILDIKDALDKSKTLLITREYFEKKWFCNSVNFLKYINHPITLSKKIDNPVLIVSSGPSLKPNLDTIKNNKDKLFIICLSSAISVLLKNNIIPDLCITTDGGFWAGQHLKKLCKYDIPIAVPLEGYIQKDLLKNKRILSLGYEDGLSSLLEKELSYPTIKAQRNGTVSGTALCFALEYSKNDIFFCGLDMSSQRGYQHTQPNEIELNNCLTDNKINSKEKRISRSEYSKGVMHIYKEWFDTLTLKNRTVYRVIDEIYKHNTLGKIKDITSQNFKTTLNSYKELNKENLFINVEYNKNDKKLYNIIKNNLSSKEWMEKLYPLSYSSLTHNENNTDIINRINNENIKLLNKIGIILDD